MKYIFILLFILIFNNVYCDDFWLSPTWNLSYFELTNKYKFSKYDTILQDINVSVFIGSNEVSNYALYYVNDKSLFTNEGLTYFVLAGFYTNSLEYVILATKKTNYIKELDDSYHNWTVIKDLEKNIHFVTVILEGTIFNDTAISGFGCDGTNFFEIQNCYGHIIRANYDKLQIVIYKFNHHFFKNLKFENSDLLIANELIFTRTKYISRLEYK